MAQLERTRRSMTDSPRMPKQQISPTFEQLLRVDESFWSPSTTPKSGMSHEECLSPNNNKKSVLSKVKERAKKLKHSLSGRKNVHGNELGEYSSSSTPTYIDHTLDDYVDHNDDELVDDPEYLGAPMYESEAAPENLKENARQHPRATPVVAESHRMPNMTKSVPETLSEKLSSKVAGLTIAPPEEQETAAAMNDDDSAREGPARINVLPSSSSSPGNETKKYAACCSPQTYDKGVSVKEYFLNKLEPGDDERALSHAITEAISPRGSTNNSGVVEKVKGVVTSFFRQEENVSKSPSKLASSFSASPRSSDLPVTTQPTESHSSTFSYVPTANSSTNANEVLDEENHGKILQTN